MEWLKNYEIWNDRFKLIGIGEVYAKRIKRYNLDRLEEALTEDFPDIKMEPDEIHRMEDNDAYPFALVSIDCGKLGKFERFCYGENSVPHWMLYKNFIADLNDERQASKMSPIAIDDIKKIKSTLCGRFWKNSKFLTLRSYVDFQERINKIYDSLLAFGIDISDYSLLHPKLIPEVEDIELGWRGVYSCKIADLLES